MQLDKQDIVSDSVYQKRTRKRIVVLALISVGTAINYLDRAVLGVAAPGIISDFGFGAGVMGILFSAFSWTYAAAQIPGGVVLDKIGTRLTYFWSVGLWSIFTLLHGLTTGFASLLAFRLGLGISEAPCFPANSRILASWFPQNERARANSVYSVGQYFGLAFLAPLLFLIVAALGWRALFVIAGLVGLVFAAAWLKLYREPGDHPTINKAELDYIAAGGGLAAPSRPTPFTMRSMGILLRHRQIFGASLGQFAGNSTLVFFLTWFPTYLATERQMEWLQVGFFAVMPYIAASVGVLVGGQVSDRLLARTGSANIGRKLPIILGLLLASTIIFANYVESNVMVIAIMSLAFFGQGMVNLGWTLITDVAPRQLIGLTGGIFNFCANLAGIATPMVIGFIVGATGSFFGGLAYIAVVALIGVFSYVFIVGDVHRIELTAEELAIVQGETGRPPARASILRDQRRLYIRISLTFFPSRSHCMHRYQNMTHRLSRFMSLLLLAATGLATLSASGLPLPTVAKPIDPVETDGGLIAGKVLDSGVRAWFGVPFAQAPVRDLRWRPPQRLSWSGVFNADRFAPQCIQPLRGSNINHYFGHEATSEDCLYLNIWAPAGSGAGDDLPVIVWIYGGGFTIGSAAMRNYAGEGLAKKGAVYVTVGYRVGALGFLAHPELTAESPQHASGNYGFLDQVAALEWLQRNVEKFGGDPDRVTIMGQSAGSASVSSLQVSPIAKGLFHRIVGMSGSSVVDRFRSTLKEAEQTGLQYEEALGVDSIEALRHVSADKILAQQQDCQLGCSGTIRVGPTVDGYFMTDEPSEVFARGEQIDVPIMVGFTRDEGFSAIGGAQTVEQYRGFLQEAYGDKAEELFRLYPASTDAEARRAARDVARDSTLGLSMFVWAELQTEHGDEPSFSYLFARVHPYTQGVKFADHDPATVGAYHTADVPYWLQTLDSLNIFRETRTYTDYDRRLSDLMSDAIVAFAAQGNPTTEALQWPEFSPRNPQLVELGLEADKLFEIKPWPNAEKLQFFRENEAKPISSANIRRDPRD